ncbi:type VI secretion system lipoprotein TssJ [Vogesella amnigena]|uniref:Type VI secretion system lipoprotein TssJ n=1 Tax=Vogesella amnigena TaxID=1507449 RepID=A0ABV7TQG7_9NEIS
MPKHSSRTRLLAVLLCPLLLAGCGAMQTIKEATVNTTKAIFFSQTLRLKLDLVARAALNGDEKDQPASVVVRLYQLKSSASLEKASYEQLLADDETVLQGELISSKGLLLRPGATLSLDEPLDKATKQVAVAVFFRAENKTKDWRVIIPRDDLSDDQALRLNVDREHIRREPPAEGK